MKESTMLNNLKSINKTKLAKGIVGLAVGMGTTRMVKGFVQSNVTVVTKVDQITVGVASVAIAGLLGTMAAQYASEKIDEIVEFYVKAKAEADKTTA
jgi:lipid-binding SYLF domain-containing protein